MLAIIDYGMGNLRSVQKAFEKIGSDAVITQNPEDIKKAERVVLPGVGAMRPAMQRLKELNLENEIRTFIASGKPFLGICLGLQLLFEKSNEGGNVPGLKILKGSVERFTNLKVPHMGWNQLQIKKGINPLFTDMKDQPDVYFCHSYFIKPEDPSIVAATTDYGMSFVSAINKKNIFGVQFHPEKSQDLGLHILKNFAVQT